MLTTSSHLHKYLPNAVKQSAEDPSCPYGLVESLFPFPFSVSAFSSAISKQTVPTRSPSAASACTGSTENISTMPMLETSLFGSLGMTFFSPKAARQRNTCNRNCIGLHSKDDDGRCLNGVEMEAEEVKEVETKYQSSSNQESKGRNPTKQKSLDDTPKLLLAGAVSTIVSRSFVAPLERLKLEYIVGGANDNCFKTIHFIWVSEGFTGFWKGNVLNLFRMVPFKSINFVTYDMYCNWLLKMPEKKEITNSDRLVAGAVSGIAATMISLPMDTIRTRLVAPGGETLGGVVGCFQHMVHNEGFLSLYKGLMPTLLSMGPASAVFYGVYDILKAAYLKSPKGQKQLRQRIQKERERRRQTLRGDINIEDKESSNQMELGAVRTLVYGAIAGACAEMVTYPLEVIRRHLQLQETTKLGLLGTCSSIVQKDGAKALFAGVLPSILQVLPSASLSYLIYEFMKVLLKIP